MKLKVAEFLVDRLMDKILLPIGFIHACDDYVRQQNEGSVGMAFPCNINGHGAGEFICLCGIRFERLAQLLDANTPERSTFAASINQLREGGKYLPWEFIDADELKAKADLIKAEIHHLVLPFLERFSHIGAVRETLESKNHKDWYLSGGERRECILAAIKWTEGDRTGAMKIVEQGIAARQSKMAKYRYELEELKKKFLSLM